MSQANIQTVLVAALGGEGGGVLADWLVSCARQAGLAVQATSVPGVAQRTGATSYYLEWSREPVPLNDTPPIFALSPVPARVDVVIASEGLEAARLMERGFVTPDRTCLITSVSRVYTTAEKMHMNDGRFDSQNIRALATALARQAVLMDMEALTLEHNTVVSAIMFGALSGAGVLPWSVELCEGVIRASGKGVNASLAGFHAARQLPTDKVDPKLAPEVAQIVRLGEERCRDYQDEAYAQVYKQRVSQALLQPMQTVEAAKCWSEAARHLALWMCYEDVIRVADLKTRPERFTRVREEARAQPGELVRITEHFKPGVEEIASVLPLAFGGKLLAWAAKNGKSNWTMGLHIRSTSLWGYVLLRVLAKMRPWRKSSMRFAQEDQAMTAWWAAMQQLAPRSATFGLALAGLPQVLKGYGDTLKKGRANYERIWNECVATPLATGQNLDHASEQLNTAIKAALADPEGQLNLPATTHPITWFEQARTKSAS
jgi:indolepyruvate ferredoxin oxidoreductase, beta subunit